MQRKAESWSDEILAVVTSFSSFEDVASGTVIIKLIKFWVQLRVKSESDLHQSCSGGDGELEVGVLQKHRDGVLDYIHSKMLHSRDGHAATLPQEHVLG